MILIINKTEDGRLYYRKAFYELGLGCYACDFDEAHSLLSSYRFGAVVLTDANKYDGVDALCRDLKSTFPKIPLIMLAQGEENELLDKIIKYADNIIVTNTPMSKVVEIIFEYVRLFHQRESSDMICGPVRVLYHGKRILVFGQDFRATKTEYAILRYFVNASPYPVSTEEIIRLCFKTGAKASQTNVTSYIHIINQKAQKMFGEYLIEKHSKGFYKISM